MDGRDSKGRWDSLNPRGEFFTQSKFGKQLRRRGARTNYGSSLTEGQVTLDPSIRALQDKALRRSEEIGRGAQGGLDEFLRNQRNLRARFEGNQGAFQQALVNPILRERDARLGESQREAGLRGIAGSSFASQNLDTIRGQSALLEGDARAQAEHEQLSALTGIDKGMIDGIMANAQLQAGLNGENFAVAGQRLEAELRALGLGQQQIEMFMKSFEASQERVLQRRKAVASTVMQGITLGMGGGGGGGSG